MNIRAELRGGPNHTQTMTVDDDATVIEYDGTAPPFLVGVPGTPTHSGRYVWTGELTEDGTRVYRWAGWDDDRG